MILSKIFKKCEHTLLLLVILCIFVFIGTFQLDKIPGEWFEDISIVNSYILSILSGQWPFNFSAAGGPLYMYLISPLIAIFGVSYLTYKFISVGVGVFGLIAIYLFAKQIATTRIAVVTTLVTALSFWYLVWARLGNYNIMAPLITALMMYFFVRYLKKHNIKWLSLSIFTSCLGLFTYAGIFLLPFILFLLLVWEMVIRRRTFDVKRLMIISLLYAPGLILFTFIVLHNVDNFINGYLGTKIINTETLSVHKFISRMLVNAFRTATMLHVEGDIVFRWNISKMPMLDWLNGIFFIVGLIYCVIKEKKVLPYLLIPLLLLPIPSMLPGHPPVEVPSSPRTMAIIPFVFLFVAYGIDFTHLFIQKSLGVGKGLIVLFVLLVLIGYLNMNNYFVKYPIGLPNINVPFGKIIANYIDNQPTNTSVYLVSLGWGDWGQPERDSIYYSLKNRNRIFIDGFPTCNPIPKSRFIVILAPDQLEQVKKLQSCSPKLKIQQHLVNGQKVFWSLINQ